MKFEVAPKLILTKDEFETLDNALKLCRDMDEMTVATEDDDGFPVGGCNLCPFKDKCSLLAKDCVYTVAHTALKKIIDIAIAK
jgi:hypothetical protein